MRTVSLAVALTFASTLGLAVANDRGALAQPKPKAPPTAAATGEERDEGGPTSKGFERARKLYEHGDYYSASIEFDKVIKGNEDTPDTKQRAEFFMGKTLFHLHFYGAALVYFDNIVQKGAAHKFYRPTLQWLAALAEVLPESAGILKKIGQYSQQDLNDPALSPVRAKLEYLLGRYYYQAGQLDQAIAMFQKVPRESEWFIHAKYLEGVCWVLVPKGKEAIDAFKEILLIAADPELRVKYKPEDVVEFQERAQLAMARVFYQTKQFDLSIRYFEKLPEESPDWVESLFDASWAYYLKKNNSKALGNIHTLNAPYFENEFFPESLVLKAQIYFNYCQYDKALEAVGEFQRDFPPVRDELRKILKLNPDDNSGFYEYVKKIQKAQAGLSDRTQLIAEGALQDRTLLKTFAYVEELDRENKQYEAADKAWKTTRIAGEVQQYLTLQGSLAADQAGSLARERLDRLEKELTDLRGQSGAVKISILEARIGKKRAELSGAEVKAGSQEEPIIVDDEHQTWDFEGEYWKDELGFYRYRIASKCGPGGAAGAAAAKP